MTETVLSLLLILLVTTVTCLGRGEVARCGLDTVPGVQPGPLDAGVGGGGDITRGAVTLTATAGRHPGLVRLLAEHRHYVPVRKCLSDS